MKSLGVELNPWLVWYSRWSSWRTGTSSLTSFRKQDLWKLPLKPYDNIVIFGVEEMVSKCLCISFFFILTVTIFNLN